MHLRLRPGISLRALGACLLISCAEAQDNTITNNLYGGNDSWNISTNWSLGHTPTNAEHAVVASNLTVDVQTAPTPWSGNLTLQTGARINVRNNAGQGAFPAASATMTMQDQATVHFVDGGGTFTFASDIAVLGDALFSHGGNGSHHETKVFSGVISGAGALRFVGSNNNIFRLGATNTLAGGFTIDTGNSRIEATVDGAMGTGDVVVSNTATLRLGAGLSNVIDNAASLYLVGPKSGHGGTSKLDIKTYEVVNRLSIDGFEMLAGSYTNASGPWISGDGTLVVLTNDPDATPPTLMGSDFVDDIFGGPVIYEDFTQIVYTVTFSEFMDGTSVDTNDFGNAGTAAIAVKSVAETSTYPLASIYQVVVALLSPGTIQLRSNVGATMTDLAGNPLDTSGAIADDTIITRLAGAAPVTTLGGTGGGNNSWNTWTNWDNGIPRGLQDAVVPTGSVARISGPGRPYVGTLTVGEGAELNVYSGSDANIFPGGGGAVVFGEGTDLIVHGSGGWGSGFTIPTDVSLLGDLRIVNSGGGSHHQARVFVGQVSGAGSLTMFGSNNNTLRLTETNTHSGGTLIINGNSRLEANSDGSLGSGDVTIGSNTTLRIAASLSDAIDDDARLSIYGARDAKLAQSDPSLQKLDLKSDETVGTFQVEGLSQPAGTWGAAGSGATYQTNIFSGGGILTVRFDEIPAAGTVLVIR